MKIIIVGCGKVGNTITAQLIKEKHDITLIDIRSNVISDVANRYDVMGVVGNGASLSVQKEAGIDETDLLIAVTDSDELNLLCCLIAKKAGNCSTIARVRNPVYSKEIGFIKDELGLSMTINPEYAAATEIARILRFPSAIKIEPFARGRAELLKFRLSKDSGLAGCNLIEISKKTKADVLICAVERGEEVIIPNGRFVLEEGDLVFVLSTPKSAKVFFDRLGLDTHQVKNTFIVGGGTIGYYLAEQLINMGIPVKIVERDRTRCEELSELLPKATIINGDATDQEILLEEGIVQCDSFVSLTGIDEGNIFLSLFAKNVSKGKVITKIDRISYDNIIDSFELGSLINPKSITAEYIIRYVRAMQNSIGSTVEALYRIIENKAEALEFVVNDGSPVIGRPLEKLTLKKNLLVGCINRNGKIMIPNGKTEILPGDTVIVITTETGLNDIREILDNK